MCTYFYEEVTLLAGKTTFLFGTYTSCIAKYYIINIALLFSYKCQKEMLIVDGEIDSKHISTNINDCFKQNLCPSLLL